MPAKPTALKIAAGNPGKRALPKDEPRPAEVAEGQPAPEWMSPEGKAEWSELAPLLADMKVLSIADIGALATLCEDLVYLRKIDDEIDGQPLVKRHFEGCPARRQGGVCDCTGPMSENPAMRARDRVWRRVHAGFNAFGMTPSMRSKVTTIKPPPTPQDESARRFFGPRNKA